MQCPVDGTTLAMTDRSGVEIDYCPQCRGIWLDRGELDKILERANGQEPHHPESFDQQRDHSHDESHERNQYGDNNYHSQKKKRERGGFLEDIFGGFGD